MFQKLFNPDPNAPIDAEWSEKPQPEPSVHHSIQVEREVAIEPPLEVTVSPLSDDDEWDVPQPDPQPSLKPTVSPYYEQATAFKNEALISLYHISQGIYDDPPPTGFINSIRMYFEKRAS